MTIRAIIKQGKNEFANVLLRIRESRGNINLFFNTEIKVSPNLWNAKKEEIRPKPYALPFELNLNNITGGTLQEFGMFYHNDGELQQNPNLKDVFVNVNRVIEKRSMNTVNKLLRAFRSFLNQAILN